MRLDRFDSVGAFLRAAGPFLRTREAEHCLILGISANLRLRAADSPGEPPYLATVRDGRRVVLVAFQTPPWQLVLSEVDDPAALGLIVADRLDRPFDEVVGPAEHVGVFAELWAAAAGVSVRRSMRERIFRLAKVVPPWPVGGAMRRVEPGDRETLVRWISDFITEAFGEARVDDLDERAERWLAPSDDRTMYVWQDGDLVSMAGLSGSTPTGIRVGPVYTPPAVRDRGYASNLVAAVSQGALDAGKRSLFLFTDVTNSTSNHIYQAVGFEPIRDVDQYRFGD